MFILSAVVDRAFRAIGSSFLGCWKLSSVSYKKGGKQSEKTVQRHSWSYLNHIEPIQAVYLACAVWHSKSSHVTGEIDKPIVHRNSYRTLDAKENQHGLKNTRLGARSEPGFRSEPPV